MVSRVQDIGASAGAASVTVNLAATPTVGNQLWAFATSSKAVNTHSMPAGWVQVKGFDKSGGTVLSLSVWKKIAGVSEPTSIQFASTAAGNCGLIVVELAGLGAEGPGVTAFDHFCYHDEGGVSVNTIQVGPVVGTRVAHEVWYACFVSTNLASGVVTWTNGFATVRAHGRIALGEKIVAVPGDAVTNPSWVSTGPAMGVMITLADTPLENVYSGWGPRL